MYAFAITKDFIDEGASAKTIGPRGVKLSYDEIIRHPNKELFRMRDDDNTLYYEGFIVDLDGNMSGFEPLEDFGIPMAGASIIKTLKSQGYKVVVDYYEIERTKMYREELT